MKDHATQSHFHKSLNGAIKIPGIFSCSPQGTRSHRLTKISQSVICLLFISTSPRPLGITVKSPTRLPFLFSFLFWNKTIRLHCENIRITAVTKIACRADKDILLGVPSLRPSGVTVARQLSEGAAHGAWLLPLQIPAKTPRLRLDWVVQRIPGFPS